MMVEDGVGVEVECPCGNAEPSYHVKNVGKGKYCASGIRQCGWLRAIRVQELAW